MSSTTPQESDFDLSPGRITELAALADTAATDAKRGWYEISSALTDKRAAADVDAIAIAFDFRLQDRVDGNSNPVFHAAQLTPVAELPTSVADLWANVVGATASAPVRARLHDLLFTLGRQPKHKHAEQACRGYVEVGAGNWGSLYRVRALARALDIARQMNRNDLADDAVKQIIANARESLDSADWQPGVFLRLIGRLVEEKNPPTGVDDLLTEARARYAGDPYVEVDTAMVQRRLAKGDKDALERIDREIVGIWTKAAEASAGLQKLGYLTKAVDYARDHGQIDLLATATTAMQAIGIEDLEMQTFRVPIEIPGEEISKWIGYFTQGDDWRVCLARFADGEQGTPPTGRIDESRAQVETLKKDASLYSMIPHSKIGGDGLPRWEPQNEDDQEEQRLADVELFRMQLYAPLFAKALYEIGFVHQPIREEVEEFFAERTFLPPDMPRVLADALTRYWRQDYEACAYLLAPKIETMLRALARAIDEPVYLTQRKNTPGKYVGLGTLISTLGKHGLDESWGRYLSTLLAGPTGWNLRNELAHGFVDEVSAPMAALLIQAALYVANLVPRADEPPAPEVE
ncbi:MAG TPA: DUF4209 domain-containing protein [Amycolatopsis sp.]|uniref:DUF4209 domain-containing protein n=1 Tax=Amycolatopsis nalaikhensis TaxID=715472 RepID=A0ABY8Y1M8_9PSEU|nr:DUF4209 domain-containing protein [Amycolatopsis sp. 2-2]WIV61883.1 DUF4209 domain-containing protein [Amycolatopsis sp. 2-2]HWD03568.1 DUF4209 domain-containing protein [Amycolatopsis sp.]